MVLEAYEAQKLSEETGIDVWTIMQLRMLGVEIDNYKALIKGDL
jgi:hypothetical protein